MRNLRRLRIESVYVGIERKKSVAVVQGAKELALHLGHAVGVELEVVPGLGVGKHVPAQRVAAVLLHGFKRIHAVAQPL